MAWYAGNNSTNNGSFGWLFSAPGGISYTLTCSNGSYSLTGQSASFKNGYSLSCSNGSYVLTGQSALFKNNYYLSCSTGSYVVTGQSVSFGDFHNLNCLAGFYLVTGQDVDLTYTPVEPQIVVKGGYKPKQKTIKKEREEIENAVSKAVNKALGIVEPEDIVEEAVEQKAPEIDYTGQLNDIILKMQAESLGLSIEQYLIESELDDEEAILLFL